MEVAAAAPPRREGYWFAPTDEELIDYLNKKAANKPILVAIHGVDITRETPITLSETYPKLGANEWYFFAEFDRKYPNGKRPDRRCGPNGVLKASQGDKKIYSAGGQLIGFQKKLIFCEERGRQKPRKLENTDWKVDEYRLNRSGIRPDDDGKLDWVLLRIYQRSYRKRNRQDFDPPVPENTRNQEAVDQINVEDDHPGVPTENNDGSTTEYNALMHDMDAPAAAYKIPKLIHYGSDVDFSSGSSGPVPVNTVMYNPTNYGEGGFAMVPAVPDDAYYYDAPPPQLLDFDYPYINSGIPSPTDDARNLQSMDDPCVVPVVNTGTTGNTFDQRLQQISFSYTAIDYSTPSPIDDARNQEAIEVVDDHPGVPAVNSSTIEYNALRNGAPDMDFSAVNSNIPFPMNTITGDARNREATENVDDPASTGNAIVMPEQINFEDFDFQEINFDSDVDFSSCSYGPVPVNTVMYNPTNYGEEEFAMVPAVPDDAYHYDAPPPQLFDFNYPYIDSGIPSPTDDARNRQSMDDPCVPVVNTGTGNTFDQIPQQINFSNFSGNDYSTPSP